MTDPHGVHGDRAGTTYEQRRDRQRLDSQADRIFELMQDGRWRTLAEITDAVGGSQTGASARLRDFRKPEFGGHDVRSRPRRAGSWEYALIIPLKQGELFA